MLGLHISLHKAIDDVTSRLGHGNNRQPRKEPTITKSCKNCSRVIWQNEKGECIPCSSVIWLWFLPIHQTHRPNMGIGQLRTTRHRSSHIHYLVRRPIVRFVRALLVNPTDILMLDICLVLAEE